MAEAIKKRFLALGELKRRVAKGELENKLRNHIAEHPHLIAPDLETFTKDLSLRSVLKKARTEARIPDG